MVTMTDLESKASVAGGHEPAAVEVSDLKKVYGKVEALKGVNLRVQNGTIFGLVGPNGAGKTTLIKALVGALRPSAGTIRVLGLDPLEKRWALRRQIGYMPQSTALYDDLSARANILFFNRAQPVDDLPAKVDEILDFTELKDRADDPINTFSGGMKKRVSLACALVHQPRIIFLDEPTAAVDPHLRFRMWGLFRGLADQGVTLFISTHLMEEALLCDRVAVLRQGVIIADDKPSHLLEAGRVRLTIHRYGETEDKSIASTPEALAGGLHSYGLAPEVEAVTVEADSLEDVILAIIEAQGEP
jgi:ABC-2 type transport system ATP-binding protein